jgi:hypothetical protein
MDVVFVRGNRPRRYSVSLSLRIMSNFADLLASFKASAGAIAGSNSGNLNKNSSIDNSNTSSSSGSSGRPGSGSTGMGAMVTGTAGREFSLHLTRRNGDFATIGTKTGTDKIHHHQYHRFYPRFLDRLRGSSSSSFATPTCAMLEVGIDQSASLGLWLEYFPTHHIYGIDIGVAAKGPRHEVFKADQSNSLQLHTAIKNIQFPLNFVVDDGSHLPDHQLFTFHELFPALVDGGVYIIEDLETSYWTKKDIYGYKTRYGYRHPRSAVERLKAFIPLLAFSSRRNEDHEVCDHIHQIANVTFGQNCMIAIKTTRESEESLLSKDSMKRSVVDRAGSSASEQDRKDSDDDLPAAKRGRASSADAAAAVEPASLSPAKAPAPSTAQLETKAAPFGSLLGHVGWEAERDFLYPYTSVDAGAVALIGVSAAVWGQFFYKFRVVEFQFPDARQEKSEDRSGQHTRVHISKAPARSMGELIVQRLRSTAEPVYVVVHDASTSHDSQESVFNWGWFDTIFTESLQSGGSYVIRFNPTSRESQPEVADVLSALIDEINNEYLTEHARDEQDRAFRGILSRRCRECVSSVTIGRGFVIIVKKTEEQMRDRTYSRAYRFADRL